MRACPKCRSCVLQDLEFCPLDGSPLIETAEDPLVGHYLGRYRVEALLGRGAMGSVYRAIPPALDRAFAVKVLHGDMAADKKLVTRFRREAEALSRIRHTNIVSVVDFVGTDAGLCALVMEYLPGIDLAELLATSGPLPPARLRPLARGVAAGLDAAHGQYIVHRDVKPSNVRIVREGDHEVPKLVDFGVVRLEDQDPEASQLTGQDHLVGTPRYMAPEMVLGQPVTPAVDLYALGVMMHEMATGKPPFEGQTTADVLVKQATEAPPPLPPLGGLEALIFALMQKAPEDRPRSAAEVVRWLDGPPGGPIVTPAGLSSDLVLPGASPDPPPASTAGPGVKTEADATLRVRPPGEPGRRTLARWAPWAAGALALAVAGGLALARRSPSPATATAPDAGALVDAGAVADAGVAPDRAPRRRSTPPPRRVSAGDKHELEAAEETLGEVLTQRGLTRSDLADIRETRRSYRQWRRARAKGRHRQAAKAVRSLTERARKVKLTSKILDRRLDRLLKAIRGSRREVPDVLREELDRRYFDLRVQAREVKTDAQFRRVSRRITLLERKLAKYRYGD